MQVSYKTGWSGDSRQDSLECFIFSKLDDDGYNEDMLRGMSKRTENVAHMVANLVSILTDKGLLNQVDLLKILGIVDYNPDEVKLVQ